MSNWKKLQAKIGTPAQPTAAAAAPHSGLDDDATAAIARAMTLVAEREHANAAAQAAQAEQDAQNAPINTNRKRQRRYLDEQDEDYDEDRTPSRGDQSGDDDDEGKEVDLLDALAAGTAGDLPTHRATSTAAVHRIPAAFAPTDKDPLPTTVAGWFTYLDAREQSHGDRTRPGKYVALDCEMVGVGPEGEESALARVSIVNFHGHVLLDTFVAPQEAVVDYRTQFSGVTPALLRNAPPFRTVLKQVAEVIKDRVLVGHSIINDFAAMKMNHPKTHVRDTAYYHVFHKHLKNANPGLRHLAQAYLGIKIQGGEHDSVEDARVTMLVFRMHRENWESYLGKIQAGEIKPVASAKKKKSAAHWAKVHVGASKKGHKRRRV
ncbi:ribonuclease H-like domain-containing protein [Blastocladiella britannica]|nr:ribonuclease H-like domain-containing protein [Blastocladiella britannica]